MGSMQLCCLVFTQRGRPDQQAAACITCSVQTCHAAVPACPALQHDKMGPFLYKKMKKWLDGRHFPETLVVQHQRTGMWVPVWYLAAASGQVGEAWHSRESPVHQRCATCTLHLGQHWCALSTCTAGPAQLLPVCHATYGLLGFVCPCRRQWAGGRGDDGL